MKMGYTQTKDVLQISKWLEIPMKSQLCTVLAIAVMEYEL